MVMVAMSPCAFVIAIPVTVLASVGASSRVGALVKGGAILEALAEVRIAALDKTGTLTGLDPRVIDVLAVAPTTRHEVLAAAAALEARSEHPLAGAILAAVAPQEPAEDVEAVPGGGLVGRVRSVPIRLGRPGFVDPGALEPAVARLQDAGATVVLVERAGTVLGSIAVQDELRPEATETVAGLRAAGIEHVVMLTGDNRAAGETLGRACGVDEVMAELLPEGKVAAIRELAGVAPVLMVGDGINDAPALAYARVGVAMGALGSDLAVDAADVALMGNDLRRLPQLLRHARRTQRIVRQNVVLATAVMAGLVPLALTGVIGLTPLVLVHEFSGVLIILNGLRAGSLAELRPLSPTPATIDGVSGASTGGLVAGDEAGKGPQVAVAARRAAVALASVAVVVGLGGGLLHASLASRSRRYPNWILAAEPVLTGLDRVGQDSVKLHKTSGPTPSFMTDCAGARREVDRLATRLPEAPDRWLRDMVATLLREMRQEYDACAAGDNEAMTASARRVDATRALMQEYLSKKTGSGHNH
jgi:soluble P-type ATPase